MTLYLIEINTQGDAVQLVTIEGEVEDFKDSKIFKVFTNYQEAQAKMGKHWTGSLWEDVPKQQKEEKKEEKPSLEERLAKIENAQLATQDALATMYEDSTKRNLQVDETLATIYEALTDKGENK